MRQISPGIPPTQLFQDVKRLRQHLRHIPHGHLTQSSHVHIFFLLSEIGISEMTLQQQGLLPTMSWVGYSNWVGVHDKYFF